MQKQTQQARNMICRNWRMVEDHEGYFVSRFGQVLSLRGLAPKFFKLVLDAKGYPVVSLSHPNRVVKIHRLVAKAFIPNPENKPHVAHKDGNPLNSYVDNLRWSTCKENEQDKERHGRVARHERHGAAKLSRQNVIKIKKSLGKMKIKEIAKKYRVSEACIKSISCGTTWKGVE